MTKTNIGLNIDANDLAKMKALAKANERSLSAEVRLAVREYLERRAK